MIFNMFMGEGGASGFPEFDYTGQFQLIDDGKQDRVQNWRIKFLTSGVLTFKKLKGSVDAFLVGAGGGGAPNSAEKGYSAGGGGGYVNTVSGILPAVGEPLEIVIGSGVTGARGGTTTAFGASAEGGYPGNNYTGGDGGSGGGCGAGHSSDSYSGAGGVDGGDGETKSVGNGGTGSQQTTREFATSTTKAYIVGSTAFASDWLSDAEDGSALSPVQGTIYSVMTEGDYQYHDYLWDGTAFKETDLARLYSGGGWGGQQPAMNIAPALADITARTLRNTNGKANTGAGGGGDPLFESSTNTAGGSGIVIIRNAR